MRRKKNKKEEVTITMSLNKQATPFKCPVCNGKQMVSFPPNIAGDAPGLYSGTSLGPYPCRVCDGTGIVWSSLVTWEGI